MKRDLPRLDIGARPGVRSDVTSKAMSRWDPCLKAAATDDAATISILDVIGADMFGEGVTAKRIAGALRYIGDRPVTVTINSPGGDVFEGIAIYNLLRDHPSEVTVKVIGLAASAASIIAMAGDNVLIGRAGFMMIHNSWVVAMGDRNAFAEISEYLKPFDDAMADVYAQRTGTAVSQIASMMDAETWINGTKAVETGFADGYLDADAVTIDGDEATASALRAERKYDLVAARAGLSRSDSRALLQDIKGGMPGAAPTGGPEAAALEAGLQEIRALLSN